MKAFLTHNRYPMFLDTNKPLEVLAKKNNRGHIHYLVVKHMLVPTSVVAALLNDRYLSNVELEFYTEISLNKLRKNYNQYLWIQAKDMTEPLPFYNKYFKNRLFILKED